MMSNRSCGILLHPTSLPGATGIGTLGEQAHHFIDLMAAMGMSCWQVLPLNPPSCGNSPYSAFSAFAGNPLLIDLDLLVQEDDLTQRDMPLLPWQDRVDFGCVIHNREPLFRKAAAAFFESGRSLRMEEFWHFCDTTPWLHNYALFMALKGRYKGKSWHHWPKGAALLTAETYEKASVDLGAEIGLHKYLQWQFFRQWSRVRSYAADRGVEIVGDIPIFVAYDSADVWANRELFLLDGQGRPTVVAGVPPDYFSNTGQLWGNPLYDWQRMESQGYSWWIDRFSHMFSLFDCIRVDHFRGFEAAWHVPADHINAIRGSWVAGPGRKLFDAVAEALGKLPIIAEDLGVITPEVEALRDACGFPGMKILQFAFDSGPDNAYLPHNHSRRCVVYTGTHDNDTTVGWFTGLGENQQKAVCEYLGSSPEVAAPAILRAALMSVADTVILPFQDLLGLPSTSRMNIPGTSSGNWGWRFDWCMLEKGLAEHWQRLIVTYGRNKRQVV